MLEQVNSDFMEARIEDPEKERVMRSRIQKKTDGAGMFLQRKFFISIRNNNLKFRIFT